MRFIALFIILFGLSLNIFLTNFDSNNIPSTEDASNDFERDFPYSNLKNQALSSDNIYDGIGAPWNVTHYANRTDYNLPVSFSNGSYDMAEIPLGIDWEGYRLNASIKNLYDTRNWNNGTFDFGADDGTYGAGENDTVDIENRFQNWTFTDSATNIMSGNYMDSSSGAGRESLELRMEGDPQGGNSYRYYYGDIGSWQSNISIPRGRVFDSEIQFDVNPFHLMEFNSLLLSFSINGISIYSIGSLTLFRLGAGWHHFNIPQGVWTNTSNVFGNPINNSEVQIEFSWEYTPLSATYSGFTNGNYQQIFIDTFQLITKAEVKPSQIQLKINSSSVSDIDWGIGSIEINSNWQSSIVSANFSSDDTWDLGNFDIELKTDLNLYALKNSPETSYETNPLSEGAKFTVQNDSLVSWESYAYFSVPTGYEENNMTLKFPTDVNLTWVSEPQQPGINRLSLCDNSTAGLLIIPVNTISSTPDGFWKFKGKAPNYFEILQTFRNTTSTPTGNDWVQETEFLNGDYINITVKITNSPLISGYIQQTKAQLHIRFPNGTIWTGQTQFQSPDSNGLIDFNYFQIPSLPPSYEAGEYEVIVTWNNSFSNFKLNETGIIYKKFTVIHESTLQPDQGISFIENVIDDRVINIKVTFNDEIDNTAIENALVYTNFSNQIHNFSEISPGFYLFEFNATEADPGNNTLTIYANATFYVNNILNITVEVVKETLLTFENDFFTASWSQNFTLRFNYTEKADPGIGINTSAISIDWIGEYYLNQTSIGRYELTCNTSTYSALTLQSFVININANNYQAQFKLIRVQINELGSILELFLNGVLANSNDKITIELDQQINITVKYRDLLYLNHLSNASVTIIGGQISTNLTENQQLEQYTIIISGMEFGQTIDTLSVFAKKDNYDLQIMPFLVEVTEKQTEIQLFLNRANKTSDPLVELPIGATLNLTIKYTDKVGNHMGGSDVQLIGDDFIEDLIENITLKQYTLIIDTAEDLHLGVNILTVVAQGTDMQTKTINPRITVRRIFADISLVSGDLIINIETGGNAALNVILNNTDFGGFIKNATVKYSWAFGTGDLLDTNNDGIYSAILRDIPEGSYAIIITAFVNDNYYFESYEIIVTAITKTTDDTLFQILFIISIIGAAVLGSYLIAYQKYLKYPKTVRKVRKYRKSLKRKTEPRTNIISRKKAITSLYKEELHKTSNILKVKPPVSRAKGGLIEKLPPRYTQISEPKKPKLDDDTLIDKSLDKKAELDKIVDKSTKDNSP